jgi:hypothetical protein
MRRPSRRGALGLGAGVLLGVLGAQAAGGGEPVAPHDRLDPSTWWRQHRAVALEVTWDLDRKCTGVEVRASDAPPAAIDSLQAVVHGWDVPPRTWPSQKRPEYARVIVFATDRTAAASGDSAVHLAPELRARLARAPFDCCVAVMRAADAQFTLDDLTVVRLANLHRPLERVQTSNAAEQLAARREGCTAVTLVASPDGRWVLDPFAMIGLSCLGPPERDADVGYAVLDAKTGHEVFTEVRTTWSISLAAWLDDHRFVMAGTDEADGPGKLQGVVRAPSLWLGDVERGTLTEYQGCPVPLFSVDVLDRAVAGCMQNAYPAVRFE